VSHKEPAKAVHQQESAIACLRARNEFSRRDQKPKNAAIKEFAQVLFGVHEPSTPIFTLKPPVSPMITKLKNIKDEVRRSKLRLMDINPQCALELKDYQKRNQRLFKFRKFVRDFKIIIIKRGYLAYNKILVQNGLPPKKLVVSVEAFKNVNNSDLKQQLLSIGVVENRKEHNNSKVLQNSDACTKHVISFINSHHLDDCSRNRSLRSSGWNLSITQGIEKLTKSSIRGKSFKDFEKKQPRKADLDPVKMKIIRMKKHKKSSSTLSNQIFDSRKAIVRKNRRLTKKYTDFK